MRSDTLRPPPRYRLYWHCQFPGLAARVLVAMLHRVEDWQEYRAAVFELMSVLREGLDGTWWRDCRVTHLEEVEGVYVVMDGKLEVGRFDPLVLSRVYAEL